MPQVQELLALAEENEKTRIRNQKLLNKFIDKALKDSSKTDLIWLLEGAATKVRLIHEKEQLEQRKKYGLRGAD
jgi:hypothetical protein